MTLTRESFCKRQGFFWIQVLREFVVMLSGRRFEPEIVARFALSGTTGQAQFNVAAAIAACALSDVFRARSTIP